LLARGVALTDTLFYVSMASLGPVVGTLVSGAFIDRVPKRTVLLFCAGLMLIAVATFFASRNAVLLVASVMTFSLGMAIYLPAIAAHGAEIFPLRIRVTATSIGWACNRLAAAMAPMLLLPLARSGDTALVEAVLCLSLATTMTSLIGVRASRR
jgi:putative MFS transporter